MHTSWRWEIRFNSFQTNLEIKLRETNQAYSIVASLKFLGILRVTLAAGIVHPLSIERKRVLSWYNCIERTQINRRMVTEGAVTNIMTIEP